MDLRARILLVAAFLDCHRMAATSRFAGRLLGRRFAEGTQGEWRGWRQ